MAQDRVLRFPRISLRLLLIAINLAVLVLPVAGIQLMRLYESALVRQTESALIAQGAFVAAFYRSLLREEKARTEGAAALVTISRPISDPDDQWRDGRWSPRPPTLDLAESPILPPFPDGVPGALAEPVARRVGRRLRPMLKDAQLVTLAGIRVTDPWGVIIASTGYDVGLSIADGEELAVALAGGSASRLRKKTERVEDTALNSVSRAGGVRVFVSAPIVLDGRLVGAVMLSRTPPSIGRALYAKRWLFLTAFALLFALVLIMSLLTSRLIARPIARLARWAERVRAGQEQALDEPIPPARTTEVARLQEAIEAMAETLQQRARYLQDFSRHVSHEFKTPLAGIRGAIEVLEDHGDTMTPEQRMRFQRNIAADAERLHRLTERLMELTKAEMAQAPAATFELAPAVAMALAAFSEQALINAAGVEQELRVRGDAQVLVAVLEILAENALQHEATELRVWSAAENDRVVLYVQDNGSGISPGNRDKIFDPFFTTERDTGGTGLGLSIAAALLKQVGGEVRLVPGNGPTTFRLILTRG